MWPYNFRLKNRTTPTTEKLSNKDPTKKPGVNSGALAG